MVITGLVSPSDAAWSAPFTSSTGSVDSQYRCFKVSSDSDINMEKCSDFTIAEALMHYPLHPPGLWIVPRLLARIVRAADWPEREGPTTARRDHPPSPVLQCHESTVYQIARLPCRGEGRCVSWAVCKGEALRCESKARWCQQRLSGRLRKGTSDVYVTQ